MVLEKDVGKIYGGDEARRARVPISRRRYFGTSRLLNTDSTWQTFSKSTDTNQIWYHPGNNQWLNVNNSGKISHSAPQTVNYTAATLFWTDM